jgi:3',5'-cyclic AMP phosphodiesterase CpdA
MKRIVQISDLHFGRENPALVEPLLASIIELRPDVVAVSGDLTQRATEEQFQMARDFLAQIPFPRIIIPGNHDIPLWNIYRRFACPLERYQRYIGADIEPDYADDQIFVLGMNTARSFAFKEGRISLDQIASLRQRFCTLDPRIFKVLVVHHPVVPPEGVEKRVSVGRARLALEAMEHCNADLILAGHLHRVSSQQTTPVYRPANHSILVVQSGTALSERTRGERNSFNVIDVIPDVASITIHTWEPEHDAFVPRPPVFYGKRGEWRRIGAKNAEDN